MMDKDLAKLRLRALQQNTDQETAHIKADDVLCELLRSLGYGDIVIEYAKIPKWYA